MKLAVLLLSLASLATYAFYGNNIYTITVITFYNDSLCHNPIDDGQYTYWIWQCTEIHNNMNVLITGDSHERAENWPNDWLMFCVYNVSCDDWNRLVEGNSCGAINYNNNKPWLCMTTHNSFTESRYTFVRQYGPYYTVQTIDTVANDTPDCTNASNDLYFWLMILFIILSSIGIGILIIIVLCTTIINCKTKNNNLESQLLLNIYANKDYQSLITKNLNIYKEYENIRDIHEEINLRPGGPGMLAAKEHFYAVANIQQSQN